MMTESKRRAVVAGSLAAAVVFGVASIAGASGNGTSATTITLPPDVRQFGPGPGQSLAQANCTICHAADYVYIQPPLTDVQWRAEVVKMKSVYGAPFNDGDVDALVAYLVGQNGKH